MAVILYRFADGHTEEIEVTDEFAAEYAAMEHRDKLTERQGNAAASIAGQVYGARFRRPRPADRYTGGSGGEGRFKSKYSFLYLTFRFLYYKLRKHRALF